MKAAYSEREFQAQVVQLARMLGYLVYFTHDSRRSPAGFLDLVICGHGRLIIAELKTDKGRLTLEQMEWLHYLKMAGQDVRVWRPADWAEIEATLKGNHVDVMAMFDRRNVSDESPI